MKTLVHFYFKALGGALTGMTDAILSDKDLAIHAFLEMKTGAKAILDSLEKHKKHSNKQYQRIKPILVIVDQMIKIDEELEAEANKDDTKVYDFPKNSDNTVEH